MKPTGEGTLTLTDGRDLRWAQWGVQGGPPVMIFHGNPGSRMYRFDEAPMHEVGVHVTTVDRPGIGGSTPRPRRRFADWPEDVAQLADFLEIDRFPIYGHSMGGPHALACGAVLGDRVTRIAISGSPGPWEQPGFEDLPPPQIQRVRDLFAARPREEAERAYREQLEEQRNAFLNDPDGQAANLAEPDARLFGQPEHREIMLASFAEAFRGGIEGYFEERMAGYVDPWGFSLSDVRVPVSVFHGTEDVWVPPPVGRELARRLPDASLHELDGVGHLLGAEPQVTVLRTLLAK